jgi:hypothetical protein
MLLKLMFYKIVEKKLSNPIKIKPIFSGCLNVTHKTNAILNLKSKLQFKLNFFVFLFQDSSRSRPLFLRKPHL